MLFIIQQTIDYEENNKLSQFYTLKLYLRDNYQLIYINFQFLICEIHCIDSFDTLKSFARVNMRFI
jgi:hypothetical protein